MPLKPLHALYQTALSHCQDTPWEGSFPVYIQEQACGWLIPSLKDWVPAEYWDSKRNCVAISDPLHLDFHLQQCATALHRSGQLPPWRHEALDVVDHNAHVLGTMERSAFRALGLRTSAVHLHATTPTGQLWLAQRALSKAIDPGLWDTLVGGLRSAGEPHCVSLIRESEEEAGLPASLVSQAQCYTQFSVCRRVPEGFQHEHHRFYHCVLPTDCVPTNLDGEVSHFKTISVPTLYEWIEQGKLTLEAALGSLFFYLMPCASESH